MQINGNMYWGEVLRRTSSLALLILVLCTGTTLVGAIQTHDRQISEKIMTEENFNDISAQVELTTIQTQLTLFAVYNDHFHNMQFMANLTDNDGNPIVGETIVFGLRHYPPQTTEPWSNLGTATTNAAGIAKFQIGLNGFVGTFSLRARHEQHLDLGASQDIVSIVFPSGQAIHIKSDGSIDPPTAPIQKNGDLYFLTDDITADSAGISIERNNITLNGMGHLIQPHPLIVGKYGIHLTGRNNVTIENVRTKSFTFHVELLDSEGNNIRKNSFIGSEYPAALSEELAAMEVGVYLSHSSNNTVSQNEVTNTYGAVFLSYSINSKIYHNNFINIHIPVETGLDSVTTWDDGYPSGGNYWSNYTDVDKYRGPYQNKTGSDYIWDRPYVIDPNNQDHYPLLNKWSIADVNHDGEIDIVDAAAISAHWYPGPPVGPLSFDTGSDINGDGSIDVLDAAIVSLYWTGPPKGPLAP